MGDIEWRKSMANFSIMVVLALPASQVSLTGKGRITYKTRENFSMSFKSHHSHSHLHASHYWHEGSAFGVVILKLA
jgi:hypothetical protein